MRKCSKQFQSKRSGGRAVMYTKSYCGEVRRYSSDKCSAVHGNVNNKLIQLWSNPLLCNVLSRAVSSFSVLAA